MTREEAIKILNKAKHYDMTIFDMDYYYEALDMAIDALKRGKGHWIPLTWEDEHKIVSDFPDDMDGTWVIVTDGKSISVERIKKDAYDHFFPSGRWFELDEVKAWMPLPESYKENETK